MGTQRYAEATCGHGGWPGLSLKQAGEAAWRRFHLSRDQRAGQEEGRGGASRLRQAQPASPGWSRGPDPGEQSAKSLRREPALPEPGTTQPHKHP